MSSVIASTIVLPKIIAPNVTIPTTVFRSQNTKLLLIRTTRFMTIQISNRMATQAVSERTEHQRLFSSVLSHAPKMETPLMHPKITVQSYFDTYKPAARLLIRPSELSLLKLFHYLDQWYAFTALEGQFMALLELTLISRYGIQQVIASLEKIMQICKYRRVFDVELDALTNFMAQKYLLFLQQRPAAMPKYMIRMTMMTMLSLRGKVGMVYMAQTLQQSQMQPTALCRQGSLKNICDSVVDCVKEEQQEYPSSYASSNAVILDNNVSITFEEETRMQAIYNIAVYTAILISFDRGNILNSVYLTYNKGFGGGGGYPYFALDRKKKYMQRYNLIPKMFRAYSRLNRRRYQEMVWLTHSLGAWVLRWTHKK